MVCLFECFQMLRYLNCILKEAKWVQFNLQPVDPTFQTSNLLKSCSPGRIKVEFVTLNICANLSTRFKTTFTSVQFSLRLIAVVFYFVFQIYWLLLYCFKFNIMHSYRKSKSKVEHTNAA